jgi:4-oxalocrotonate tautomerase family enzyme
MKKYHFDYIPSRLKINYGKVNASNMTPGRWRVDMPHIQVTLCKGRTTEQKRRIARRLTDVLSEEAKVETKYISLSLVEVELDGFAEAGEMVHDDSASFKARGAQILSRPASRRPVERKNLVQEF